MEDLLENTAANISDVYMLSPEEIKLSLLNSLVTRTAIIKDKALRRAIATGKILATFSGPARKQISLSVPALIMRSSVANATPDKKLSFADVTRLEKVAAVSGWMSLRKFAVHNMDQGAQGKAFEAYHLHAEAAQWGLRLGSTNQLGDFYTNANFYSGEALKQVFKYTQPGIIVRLPALGRELFPAKAFDAHFCDAFEADTVSAALDEMCKTRSSLVPEFKFQEAYDYMYGVRLKGGRNLVVVVDTTFALDNNLKTPEELQRRLRKKVEACQKLNWAHLGLKYKRDVVQVLICYSELPADWDWELEVKNLDVSNLIVMDRSACRAFYGGLYGFTPFLYEAHNIV